MRDERHVAPVKVRVAPFGRVGEALGKNHVRRVEAAGVGAAEEDGVLRHLRIDRLVVRLGERRREHVVPVPETEQVPTLLVLPPMLQNRPRRQQRQHDQDNHRRQRLAPAIATLIAVHQKQRRQKHHEAERKRACPVIEKKLRLRQLGGPGNHRQRGGHDQPGAKREPSLKITPRNQRAKQRRPKPDPHRQHHVRRREEHPRHVAPVLVRCRVEQDHQQPGQANVNGERADHPAALAVFHLEEQRERQNRQQQKHAELVRRTLDVHLHLPEELEKISRRVCLLILAPGEGVHEAQPRPRVTPVERRVGHRGQRQEQVKRRSPRVSQAAPDNFQAFAKFARRVETAAPAVLRQRHKPQRPGHADEAHTEHVENHLHRRVAAEQLGRAGRHRHQHCKINQCVDGKKIPAQSRMRKQDHRLDAHCRDDQRLVVAKADAKPEERPVKIPHSRRVLRPSVQAAQHPHKREHTQRVHLHNHRLAPHEPAEAEHQPRHATAHQRDALGQAFVDPVKPIDALNDPRRGTARQQRQQTARQSSRKC